MRPRCPDLCCLPQRMVCPGTTAPLHLHSPHLGYSSCQLTPKLAPGTGSQKNTKWLLASLNCQLFAASTLLLLPKLGMGFPASMQMIYFGLSLVLTLRHPTPSREVLALSWLGTGRACNTASQRSWQTEHPVAKGLGRQNTCAQTHPPHGCVFTCLRFHLLHSSHSTHHSPLVASPPWSATAAAVD